MQNVSGASVTQASEPVRRAWVLANEIREHLVALHPVLTVRGQDWGVMTPGELSGRLVDLKERAGILCDLLLKAQGGEHA